jgi:homospermidine synthase
VWYLEQKESQFVDEDELEYEQMLISKALTRLAKVSSHHADWN